MEPVTIPKWIPPFPTAGVLNRQDSLPTTKINNVASGRPPRLVYGPQWVGGRIFARPAYNAGVWTVGYMVGVGEMEAIDIVHLNGALPPVGVSVNTYTGTTSQAVDPLLSSAIGGYSDSLVLSDERGQLGFANVVIQYSNDDFPAPPTVLAKVRGRKVWDPATQTTIYSQNPALIVADLIRDPWMGLGEPVDDASLIAAASACSDSVITESRRLLGITIESQQETMALIETLRVYAACWPNKRGDTWVFEPDRPAATAMTISASDMVRGSFRVGLVDEAQVPTVIKVIYTDTSSSEWHEREICYPDSIAGARRESLVRLPGVHRYSQARREAKERWNRLQRTQSLTFTGHDHTGRLERGDIIAVTHPMGLSGELFRLTEQPSQSTPGRFQIQAVEYHASDYDDSEDVDPGSTGSSGVVGELLPFGGSGSLTIFRQNDAPTANAVNDLWVELDTDQVWQWNGSAWVIFANSFDDTSQLVDSAGLGASAIWASITGTGKPDDDATQNQIFRQASQPTGTEDDLWYETDTGLWYQYTAGAWQVAANSFDNTSDLTDGAGLGDTANWSQVVDDDTNKPENNATEGADLGTNVRNEAGATLNDIDVRNDHLITEDLSALNANPTMQIPRVGASSILAPASWFSGNSAVSPTYLNNAVRDVMVVVNNRVVVNSAFAVNPGTKYEFVALVRAVTGTITAKIRAEELDTDLPTNRRAVSVATLESWVEPRTRLVDNVAQNASVGTSYTILRGTYTPTSTAKWASMSLYSNTTGDMRVEWAVVREESTKNVPQLAYVDYDRTATLLLAASTSYTTTVNGWALDTDGGAPITLVSGTEFEADVAVRIRVTAIFDGIKESGGIKASIFYIRIEKKPSGGSFAAVANTEKRQSVADIDSSTEDGASLTVIKTLDLAAGDRIRFTGHSRNSAENEIILQTNCYCLIEQLDTVE